MANYNQNTPYEVRRAHFIERAKAIWGDAFDYTDMQFTTGKDPCVITCRKHGPFRVAMAQNHILKDSRFRTGCPYCKEEQTGLPNQRLHKEHRAQKAKEEAERKAARKAEQERREELRKQEQEQKKSDMAFYVSFYGYDVSKYDARQLHAIYASLKSKEKLAKQRAERKAELERQKQLRAEERKRKEEERIRKRTADLISQAIEIHGNKYDYTKTTYEKKLYHGKMMWVLANIYCPKHGYFDARPDVHIQQGCGCALCAGILNNLSAEERKQRWLAQCHERFGDRFDYSQVEYVNNDSIVKIYCKEHDYLFETTPDTHVRGYGGCPYCSASVGEVHIRKWLDDNNVKCDTQRKVPNENPDLDLYYLVSDFFLPDYNLYIEMNGQQHYMEVGLFKNHRNRDGSLRERQRTFELQLLRDETFRKYCQDHRHNLLEIKYDQINKIPQILERTLKKYAHSM